MRKQWIDPNYIYLAKPMNPRPLNQGFIESLRESMEAQGFYRNILLKCSQPIAYRALKLTCSSHVSPACTAQLRHNSQK